MKLLILLITLTTTLTATANVKPTVGLYYRSIEKCKQVFNHNLKNGVVEALFDELVSREIENGNLQECTDIFEYEIKKHKGLLDVTYYVKCAESKELAADFSTSCDYKKVSWEMGNPRIIQPLKDK